MYLNSLVSLSLCMCVWETESNILGKGEILHYVQSSIEAMMNSDKLCISWQITSEIVFKGINISVIFNFMVHLC